MSENAHPLEGLIGSEAAFRLAEFFRRYWVFMVLGLVVLAVLVGAFVAWKAYEDNRDGKAAIAYHDALLQIDDHKEAAMKALEPIARGSSHYAPFAALILSAQTSDATPALLWMNRAKSSAPKPLLGLIAIKEAALQYTLGQREKAVSTLESVKGSFEPLAQERLGDLYFKENNLRAAKIAYESAISSYTRLHVDPSSAQLKLQLIPLS